MVIFQLMSLSEAAAGGALYKKLFLKFRKTHTKTVPATLLKQNTLAQVFSCEFSEIFKNTFFTEHHHWMTASTLLF